MDIREHSVYFDDYNSWDMWHLVPSSRPTPSVPEMRTNFVEVPGRNGSLDLSEALTGMPVYNNRTIEIEFIVYDQEMYWMDVYEDVISKIHGKRMKIRLNDDPNWYYLGRVTVGEFTSNSDYSSISVTCTVEPFKYASNYIEDTAKIYMADMTPATVGGVNYVQTTLTLGAYSHEGSGSPWNTPIENETTGSVFFTKVSPVHNATNIIYEPLTTFWTDAAIPYIEVWNNYTPYGVTPVLGGRLYNADTPIGKEDVEGMIYTNPGGNYYNHTTLRIPRLQTPDPWESTDYIYFKLKWQERRL